MNYQKVYMNQIYSSSIMRQVAQMWKNQLLCDAVIKTGIVHTKAHRLVLIAACPMLQDMENASVGSHLEVRLNSDISQSSVHTFLQYLYEGFMMLTEDNCREVEKIAKLLHVDSVAKCCVDFQKCLSFKTGFSGSNGANFDLQESLEFRYVNTTDLQKAVSDSNAKRSNEDTRSQSPLAKRQRIYPFSSHSIQKPDDHKTMNFSYNSQNEKIRNREFQTERTFPEGVIEISENTVEVLNTEPRQRDADGWPLPSDLPPLQKSSMSVSVANQQTESTNIHVVDVSGSHAQPANQRYQHSVSPVYLIDDTPEKEMPVPQRRPTAQLSEPVPRIQNTSTFSPRQTLNMSSQSDAKNRFVSSSPSREARSKPYSSTNSSVPNLSSHREKQHPPKPFATGTAPPPLQAFPSPPQDASQVIPIALVEKTASSSEICERTEKSESQIHESSDDVEKLLASESTQKSEQKSISPDLSIIKLETVTESETGSLDMYVQHDTSTESSYILDPGDEETDKEVMQGDFGRDDLSNEDSSFSGDQSGTWQDNQLPGDVATVGLVCKFCHKTFESTSDLTHHLRGEEQYKGPIHVCSACYIVFYSISHYQEHMTQRHSNNSCPVCGVMLKHYRNLRRHMLSHSVERPFICQTCGSAFKRKDHLKEHFRKRTACQRAFQKGLNEMSIDA